METAKSFLFFFLSWEKSNFTYKFPFRRSSIGTFIRQQPLTSSGSSSVDSSRGSKTSATAPRLDYRSMVSVEDMPELFVSFDSKYHNHIKKFVINFIFLLEWTHNLIIVKTYSNRLPSYVNGSSLLCQILLDVNIEEYTNRFNNDKNSKQNIYNALHFCPNA